MKSIDLRKKAGDEVFKMVKESIPLRKKVNPKDNVYFLNFLGIKSDDFDDLRKKYEDRVNAGVSLNALIILSFEDLGYSVLYEKNYTYNFCEKKYILEKIK